eukprot:scaffold169616_cov23-Tisochrysis_lutea.AAC.1
MDCAFGGRAGVLLICRDWLRSACAAVRLLEASHISRSSREADAAIAPARAACFRMRASVRSGEGSMATLRAVGRFLPEGLGGGLQKRERETPQKN